MSMTLPTWRAGVGGESLLVVRRVMDSARIMNTLSEIVLTTSSPQGVAEAIGGEGQGLPRSALQP